MRDLVIINIIPSGIGGIQTYGKTLEKKLTEEGIIVERVEAYKVDRTKNLVSEISKKVASFIINFIELSKIIRNHKNRKENIIIHAHVGKDISFWENGAYGLWAKILGVPFIFHVHSSLLHVEYKQSNSIVKGIRRYILAKTSRIIALSEYWKRQLLRIEGLHSEKITVIYNFVDVEKFRGYSKTECRRRLKLPLDLKILVSIGRLEKEKGHRYLIDAINIILQTRKDLLCIVIGDGTLKRNLEEDIRKLGLNGYVKFIGSKSPDEIPLWLNAADIFVMPSIRETFPIAMLEALAAGTPFVGSAIGAVPEVIVSEEFGLLVEPADPKDLAEKILIALEKEWNKKKIRKYGEKFTWEKIANKILNIYKEVLPHGEN
ncbi:glycosyltransferase family 4 protein [Thermococcus prieurii]